MESDNDFCIKVYSPGNFIAKEITIHGGVTLGGDARHHGFTDEQVAAALRACVGKGLVISTKRRWAGAYWYLRWACNYPVDVQQFCEKIQSLPVRFPEEHDCCYENIRKLCTLSFMSYDATRMEEVRVSRSDQPEFAICREVALKLAEELGKACLPTV